MNFLKLFKKIPIDFGQGSLSKTTMGKRIAMSFVPDVLGMDKKALDVGCRDGYFSELLSEKGYKVTSIDIEKSYSKCLIMDADEPLNFEDETFDIIWASEVIEHLTNPLTSLKEFRRVLKKGGKLIITCPNSGFWFFKIMALFGFSPKKLQHPGHKHWFRINEIRSLFPKAELQGFFPYIFIKRKINKNISILSPTFIVCETKT